MQTILFVVTQPYRLANCIMFENSDKFNYFYIIKKSNYNITVKNMFLKKKKTNYSFYNDISSIIELINEKKIKYIFFSCLNKYETVLLEIKKKILFKTFIFALRDGMWNFKQLNVINKTKKEIIKYNKFIEKYIMSNYEKRNLNNEIVGFNKIISFEGFPQLDYCRFIKDNFNDNKCKKNILFVNNYDQINLWGMNKNQNLINETVKEYLYYISFLSKYCSDNNYNLIIKIKHNFRHVYNKILNNPDIIKVHNLPHVYILDKENIYDYLDSHIILIQGYSTFYLESLSVNSNVILCQNYKICDSLESDKFNLLKSKNIEELKFILYNINNLINKTYINNINNYKKYLQIKKNNICKEIEKYIFNNYVLNKKI